ncbi:hypothetical protein B7494_g1626 [Chlorociboria aeruginascens]|nr:hypothetical protein B7494_g1626 [Chlorociboria aeruginascens]
MGNSSSTSVAGTSIGQCLARAVGGNPELVAFSDKAFYQLENVKRWNLQVEVTPIAVTYPETSAHIAEIIRCASAEGIKVQPKSGGHSYGNYGSGGVDGAISVDLKHFQQFSMNYDTWQATIGSGTALGDVTQRLHDAGKRAMAHGTCPAVGIGGHATIGGLGPTSRQWGSALDHVEEVEVVLANSTITRASPTQNPDLFWALKGAGASFGIVTEFKVRTEPEPGEMVQFQYSFTHGAYTKMADTFKAWQAFISEPSLTRRFATEVIITEMGFVVSGTFFGTKAEFDTLGFQELFFHSNDYANTMVFQDWQGKVAHWADELLLFASATPSHLFSKSMTFSHDTLIPSSTIDALFAYLDIAHKGTPLWFIILDLEGGAINDIPNDATAYAHRNALFYMQNYAIGIPSVSDTTKDFIRNVSHIVTEGMKGVSLGAYAGYVDPELKDAQRAYWGANLPRLERIKREVDPQDVFSNPQSVRPAKS